MTSRCGFISSTVALMATAAIALCGGCSSAPMNLPDQPKPEAVVEMHLHSFEPASVTIHAGQAVLWRNTTMVVWHTATFDPSLAEKPEDAALPSGVQPFNSGEVDSGHAWEHIFTTPGTYRYFCQPHESHGMLGQIIVQPNP